MSGCWSLFHPLLCTNVICEKETRAFPERITYYDQEDNANIFHLEYNKIYRKCQSGQEQQWKQNIAERFENISRAFARAFR